MHEVGLMQGALSIAIEHAREADAQHIERVRLRVGAGAGLAAESLELAFEIAARGTIAEGAHLDLEEVPMRCYCERCNLEFTPDELFVACPQCHDTNVVVRQGYECELAAIEISSRYPPAVPIRRLREADRV
jgi:hydrogenase nickel incorporation protein HypA/HybF